MRVPGAQQAPKPGPPPKPGPEPTIEAKAVAAAKRAPKDAQDLKPERESARHLLEDPFTRHGVRDGIAFASDMQWDKAVSGSETPVRRDVNVFGQPLAIAGKPYRKGLWTHSFDHATPADVVFDVSHRKFVTFKADVGIEDRGTGSVQFQVIVDGRLKAESPILRPRQVHPLRADVRGAREVTLRVLNGGDGSAGDHAVWGSARFVEAGAKGPEEAVAPEPKVPARK